MFTLAVLGAIQGHALVTAVVSLIVIGLIIWLLMWLVDYCALPEPIPKVAKIILMVFVVLALINFLLSILGRPLIVW